jgi:phage-related protein
MIALSIAMPYALAGLSSMTTAAMASTNPFLQAVGQVGNAIRTGYSAFNAGVSNAFSSITKSISQAFTKFAPQGVKDMYSAISSGAKNLYSSAQETLKQYMPKPFTGTEGTVEFFDEDGIQLIKKFRCSFHASKR